MNLPFKAGPTLDGDCFSPIRETLCLDGCKWDPQIGDVSTLAPFPIILDGPSVEFLGSTAERLSREIIEAEKEILNRWELLSRLGLPSRLSSLLLREPDVRNEALRTMRFDFHFTTSGWLISEVNSDVPGGFVEASDFPSLVSSAFTGLEPTGDPTRTWTESILTGRTGDGAIALVAAPSFTADQQVAAYLGKAIARVGIPAYLCVPSQLKWRDRYAFLSTSYFEGPVSAIVRFYQAEWLAALPRKAGWEDLLTSRKTPVANPGAAIVSESKLFPFLVDQLDTKVETLKAVFPETRSLREAPWQTDDTWVVKGTLSNCGDRVVMRSQLTRQEWETERRWILRRPTAWVAQKRFESVPVSTQTGPLYICFGVYTIDGRMAGIYGRGARRPLIDYKAVDVAVLRERSISSSHG
jgi:glutathionylspermidine synthase